MRASESLRQQQRGRWSPGKPDVVSQHQLILLVPLGLSQKESGGGLLLGSFLDWKQLNKRGSRGKQVESPGLLWPWVQAHHRCGERKQLPCRLVVPYPGTQA